MPVVSMSLPEATLRKLDTIRRKRGYASRSEAFRDALRDFIDAAEWGLDEGENTLILAILFRRDVSRAGLAALQHRYDEIATMLHTHLDPVHCLEIFVVVGPNDRLKELIQRVRRLKGVDQVKFLSTAAQGPPPRR
jgi:CopG family nickel-responsive transcriptional regulator